ncbi:MAG: hypothetical protein M0Z58_06040, partial [Nitrospiraceae bacterium]|nr:hypothetical protein [Nitrospiraceae bacterium]
MRLDKLTVKSQEAVAEGQRIAEAGGNQELQPEHLLLALLADDEGIAVQILNRLGADAPGAIKADVEKIVDRFPKASGATPLGQFYASARLKDVFERAMKEAAHLT